MTSEKTDLNGFTRNSAFYPPLNLLLTVKSFDLQAIRKRYLASRNNKTGKAGSVARRAVSTGGVARIQLKQGKIVQEQVLCQMQEPRGIDVCNEFAAIAAEDTVYILTREEIKTISQPWFSYIHTVQFSPHNPDLLAISSSGFDIFFEYSITDLQKTYEWLAWEHGFNQAFDPELQKSVVLSRKPEDRGPDVILISDPPGDAIPTAKRAAFINSVTYHSSDPDLFLATFFHEGAVFAIHRDGHSKKVVEDLHNPHGGRDYRDGYIATSTSSGEIVIISPETENRISFRNLPGKPESLGELEWIQNAIYIDNLLIAIDSNRTAFVIIDLDKKLWDIIPYNNNWAVQDLVSADETGFDRQIQLLGHPD